MHQSPDLDTRLDEALEESFPASDPPAVHSIDPESTAAAARRTETPEPAPKAPLAPG